VPCVSRAQLAGWLALVLLGQACAASQSTSSSGLQSSADSAACRTLTPTAAGGPPPPASTIVLRWLGTANYELAYRDQVVLLDAFFDRGPRNRPIGLTAGMITHADLILVGHAHWDHIADAGAIAERTRALVVGAASATKVVLAAGLSVDQTRTVTGRGGEILRFKGFTVEPVLAHHSILQPTVLAKFGEALSAADGGPSPGEAAAEAAIESRGSDDPTIGSEGTLAYLLTFDTGFRLIWLDSAGPITAEERSLMGRIGLTDVAIVAYQGQYLAEHQVTTTLPLVKLFRPRLYLPAHHDKLAGLFLDLGVEPLLMALRDELPATRAMMPLYRSPLCLSALTSK
jgi:L-ascorbate metabolism protein UlaG (beta-lactamase superfamily)